MVEMVVGFRKQNTKAVIELLNLSLASRVMSGLLVCGVKEAEVGRRECCGCVAGARILSSAVD